MQVGHEAPAGLDAGQRRARRLGRGVGGVGGEGGHRVLLGLAVDPFVPGSSCRGAGDRAAAGSPLSAFRMAGALAASAAMDLLLHFRTFVRVAELGGFSAAARALNASQPAVSRQVADLEARLGARLLHRSSTGVALTEDGLALPRSAPARRWMRRMPRWPVLGAARGEVSGRVRLGCRRRLRAAAGRAAPRRRCWRGIRACRWTCTSPTAPPTWWRTGWTPRSASARSPTPTVVARRIGMTRRAVVASARLPRPRRHAAPGRRIWRGTNACCSPASPPARPGPSQGADGPLLVPVRGRLRANSSEAVRAAVLAGMGLYLAPLWLFAEELRDGRVVAVLQDWTPTLLPIQAVFPTPPPGPAARARGGRAPGRRVPARSRAQRPCGAVTRRPGPRRCRAQRSRRGKAGRISQ